MEEADARRNIGRRLGEFVLCELIGEGGFGSVFRAEQPGLEREAVVKILRARLRDEPRAAQRFMREARLAARLDHPYAAHIYAYGAELDGVLWIAMELVRGTSLAEVLQEHGKLPASRAVPFFERLCEVVHSAHEQGIVHRDIKPHNVMVVSRAGRLLPKLLDLGIAKLVDNAYQAGAGGGEPVVAREDASLAETTADERGVVLPSSPVAPARPWLETERGALIGTPAYMAPELWRGEAADARTDIYALGVLAYEMLAGCRPLDAEVQAALSGAPFPDGVVPPIGGDVPPALDAVIARALSKERDARYTTALELGAALRAASDLPGTEPDWPRLEEAVVDAWSRDAPRPIAEAIALYEAARNLHQARDALCGLVRTLVRTAAILALACRNRVGPRPGDEPARPMLDELRRGELDDASWVELARLLAAPFARRAEAHPMPELITALTVEGPDGLAELAADCEAHRGPATEAALRELLARSLPRLGRQLRRFAFLCDYRLCAGLIDGGGAVIWRGARTALAPPAPIALEPGRAAVLDAQGGLVTMLSPLAEVARPAPGLPEALFLFAGRGRFGARLVAYPQEFERHEAGLWAEADDGATPGIDDAPYRGLAAFSAADAGGFVGREREVMQLGNRLRVEPLLLVVGPSGAGKSSFVHAGVIPTLEGWNVIVVRPGPTPLAALETRLAPHRGPDGLLPAKTVLVVDQLEEIFTLCHDPEEREAFAAALAGAGSLARGSRAIATLRDDFLSALERLAGLRERIAPAIQLLATPASADLVRIVVEPARRRAHGLDAGLAQEMVDEVADQPGALALLSFTAARLWERRDRELRRLTRKAYVELGGVGGALAQHAEEVLAGMSAEEARVVRDAFQQLLTSAGTRAVLTHAELLRSLASPRAEKVIERLVAARLLVTSQSEDGHDRVEIIHEALLTAWPRLAAWRQEDAAATRLRLALREAARQWDMRGRARGLLWRDDALAEYRLWRARHPVSLTELEEAFAGASLAEAARGRRARLSLLGTAFAVLVLVVVVLSTLYRQAQQARRAEAESAALARRTVALQYEEQGRLALLGGDHFAALAYLLEAHQRGIDGPALRFMLGKASQVLDKQVAVLAGHGDLVRSAAFLPDGRRVLTASVDNTLRLWDPPASITLSVDAPVHGATVSPDGHRAVSFGLRGPALLWDLDRGARVAVLDDVDRPQPGARFSPAGDQLVTFGGADASAWRSSDGGLIARLATDSTVIEAALLADQVHAVTEESSGTIRLWRLSDASSRVVARLPATLVSGALSSDEQVFAAGGLDGHLYLVRVADGVLLAAQRCHAPGVWNVSFSPDGKRVLTTGQETAARMWDAATGGFLLSLDDGAEVVAAHFSPDGERAITTGVSRTVGVWSARTGKLLSRMVGHTETVRDAGFSPDGSRLVSAGADRTARVWNPRADDLVAQLAHERPVFYATFTTGGRVVTSSQDGLLRVWAGGREVAAHRIYQPTPLDQGDDARAVAVSADGRLFAAAEGDRAHVASLEGGQRLLDLGPHDGRVWGVAFDRAGTRVATTDDHAARVWEIPSGKLLATFTGHGGAVVYAAFDPDGGRLVTASEDDTARVWDLRGPKVVIMVGHKRDLSSAVFSPDGRLVITSSLDSSVKLWDAATGSEIRSLLGHRGGTNYAEMSLDGAWIVSSSMDGTAKLWDSESGKLLYSFDLHAGKVWSAGLDADGRRLVTASSDGTAAIWDLGAAPEPAAIAAAGACRIPYRVDGGRLVPAPACP